HPGDGRVFDPALHIAHPAAGLAFIPGPVEVLSGGPELHNEIGRQILGIRLAPLLAPEAYQGPLVVTHNDAGVRPADEKTPFKLVHRSSLMHGPTLQQRGIRSPETIDTKSIS